MYLKFVPMGTIDKNISLVRIVTWRKQATGHICTNDDAYLCHSIGLDQFNGLVPNNRQDKAVYLPMINQFIDQKRSH